MMKPKTVSVQTDATTQVNVPETELAHHTDGVKERATVPQNLVTMMKEEMLLDLTSAVMILNVLETEPVQAMVGVKVQAAAQKAVGLMRNTTLLDLTDAELVDFVQETEPVLGGDGVEEIVGVKS